MMKFSFSSLCSLLLFVKIKKMLLLLVFATYFQLLCGASYWGILFSNIKDDKVEKICMLSY